MVITVFSVVLLLILRKPGNNNCTQNKAKTENLSGEEIIEHFITALGGREAISQTNSLYVESYSEIMGAKTKTITSILNGKGFRKDRYVKRDTSITCLNDEGGWFYESRSGQGLQIMEKSKYEAERNQIYLGSPFINYKELGSTIEFLGTEKLGDVITYKVKMRMFNGDEVNYFFDISTNLLIQEIKEMEINGNRTEVVISYSNYKRLKNGFLMPFTYEINMGMGISMKMDAEKAIAGMPINSMRFLKL